MSDTMRRAVLIIGVLAVLVGVAVVRPAGVETMGPTAGLGEAAVSGTVVTPAGAESSAWFCTGSTGIGGGSPGALLMSNATAQAVTGTVTTLTSPTSAQSAPFTASAAGQTVADPGAGVTSGGTLASSVVLNGGGVGVTQVVTGPAGPAPAPCASRTSRSWFFADASTAQGNTLDLSLLNPTDTIAVVDVTFVSSTGLIAPPAYQGIDLAGNTMVQENVGVHVPDTAHFATEVTTLSGAVVATEIQMAGQSGSTGDSVVVGAVAPASTWAFAQSTDTPQGTTVFHVFNPSPRAVRVTVTIGLQAGAAEPLVLEIPPTSVVGLATQKVTRIPASTPFAATFVAGHGAGIVVDRQVVSPAGSAAPQQGTTAGVPGGSDRWLLPAADGPTFTVASVAVVDLDPQPITVTLARFTGRRKQTLSGFGRRTVRPGLPLIVTPGPGLPLGSDLLQLDATGRVAVEIDALPAGSPGVSVIPALPLG